MNIKTDYKIIMLLVPHDLFKLYQQETKDKDDMGYGDTNIPVFPNLMSSLPFLPR